MISGNSTIPTRAAHDRHYAHCCTVCGDEFDASYRPKGEVFYAGIWADACGSCYAIFSEEQEDKMEEARNTYRDGITAITEQANRFLEKALL